MYLHVSLCVCVLVLKAKEKEKEKNIVNAQKLAKMLSALSVNNDSYRIRRYEIINICNVHICVTVFICVVMLMQKKRTNPILTLYTAYSVVERMKRFRALSLSDSHSRFPLAFSIRVISSTAFLWNIMRTKIHHFSSSFHSVFSKNTYMRVRQHKYTQIVTKLNVNNRGAHYLCSYADAELIFFQVLAR